MLRRWKFVESFYLQVRSIFPHISLRDLPCHRTKKILFLHQVSLKLWAVVCPWLRHKSWSQTYFYICLEYPCLFYFLFECNLNKHGQEMMLVLPGQTSSMRNFAKSVLCFSVLPASFDIVPRTQTRIVPFSSVNETSSPNLETFFPTVKKKKTFLELPFP